MTVTLDILFLTEQQQTNRDLGMEVDFSKESGEILIEHTFYNIDYISPDGDFCEIGSCGKTFIANIGYEKLKDMIASEMLTGFN